MSAEPPTRRRTSRWRHALATAGALALVVSVAPAAAPAASAAPPPAATSLPPGASAYVGVTPTRLADTRAEVGPFGYQRVGPTTVRVQVAGRAGIPAGATAAVVNIASVGALAAGFVTAYPTATALPLASSLNVDRPARIIANLATVRLGAGGAIDLFSNVGMDLVVDVVGAYVPADGPVAAGRLVTFPGGARRALDTREGAGTRVGAGQTVRTRLDAIGVPPDATAVVVNLAATETAGAGYWTAFPTGVARPFASSLNIDAPDQTRNAQSIVRLEPGTRSFEVFSQTGGHLVVDVVGWFTGAGSASGTDGLFVPSSPLRVLDTRTSSALPPWGGTTIEVRAGAPASLPAAAVAMNIAIAEPLDRGFITAFPAGVARPLAANLNVTDFDQIISNHGTVRMGTRGVSLYTQRGTHVIVDVTGWYLGVPDASGSVAPNPSFAPTHAVSVHAPAARVATGVGYGQIDAVVDRGLAGLYAGSGVLGTPEHNIFFAHRTEAGAPFRHLDALRVGSTFRVAGATGAAFVYLVVRHEVIVPSQEQLIGLLAGAGPATATLVACHPPGSVTQRVVVVGRLIGAE